MFSNDSEVSFEYCVLHVTLPNRVFPFISHNSFELLFLCQFLTDLLEIKTVYPPVCNLDACYIK
jgi:hypothetical protein